MEAPHHQDATWDAAPANQPTWPQQNPASWAAAGSAMWKGTAAAASSSSSSEKWWELEKTPADAKPKSAEDPWIKVDPWQTSMTWSAPTPNPWVLENNQGQMDTQQSVTLSAQDRQMDTQQSQAPWTPATQRRTKYGVLMPPVSNAFGAAVYQKQRPPKTTKPQWIEGPLYKKFGLKPELVRTTRCHRRGHKQPAEMRTAMKNYPAKWRADKKADGVWTAIKSEVDGIAGKGKDPMPKAIREKARGVFDKWLGDRSMGDMRIIRDITLNHGILEETAIIPGFRWLDFDHTPEMPVKNNADERDLYLTDFATDTYNPLASYLDMKYTKVNGKVELPQGLWLRYHGCNMYAMSSILATNMAAPSDQEVVSSETACGRGVYTSRCWEKATQYAIPHRLPGSSVFTKTIALFVVPGASGIGGVGVWKQQKRSVSDRIPDGSWGNRPRWFLVLEEDEADECWEKNGQRLYHTRSYRAERAGAWLESGKSPGQRPTAQRRTQLKTRARWCIWQESSSHNIRPAMCAG